MDRREGRDVENGQLAPNFALHNGNGDKITLIDFRGETGWLTYHPFDWPGLCTVGPTAVRRVAE